MTCRDVVLLPALGVVSTLATTHFEICNIVVSRSGNFRQMLYIIF